MLLFRANVPQILMASAVFVHILAAFHARNVHNHATDTSMMGIATFFWCSLERMQMHGRAALSQNYRQKCYTHTASAGLSNGNTNGRVLVLLKQAFCFSLQLLEQTRRLS